MEELTSTQSNDDDQENEESCVVEGEGSGSSRPNSETDCLIWSWLLDPLTEDILQDMLDREIWEALKESGGIRWKKLIEMVDPLKGEHMMMWLFGRNPSSNEHFGVEMKSNVNIEAYWWYVDSGATGHVTKYLVNFTKFSRCKGGEIVRFGNGECMRVEHIGSSSFFFGNRCCILKDLLHVPSVTKNFLSVSQFTKDNGVYFEFDSLSCFLKDRETSQILTVGDMFEGLYRFQIRLF